MSWSPWSFCVAFKVQTGGGLMIQHVLPVSLQLYEILARTPYGSVKNGEVGIDRLISEQAFAAAYPLHEVWTLNWDQIFLCVYVKMNPYVSRQLCLQGDFKLPNPPVPPQSLGLRQILYEYWSKWSCWRRYQPLDHIREYFGEKIALYFAWIGNFRLGSFLHFPSYKPLRWPKLRALQFFCRTWRFPEIFTGPWRLFVKWEVPQGCVLASLIWLLSHPVSVQALKLTMG